MGNPFIDTPPPPEGMCYVSASLQTLVPTVQFGNVTLGPVSATRIVPDSPASRIAAYNELYAEIRDILSAKTGELLLLMQNAAKGGNIG